MTNKPARKILRVLILDDSPDDAEQASAALRKAGYMLKTQRLETGVAVEQNLEGSAWDLILCGHGISSLPVKQVVDLVMHKKLLTPVIVMARRIVDEEILTIMRAGARDVIMKGQWGRLAPAVERELTVADERRQWLEGREAKTNLEARYKTMIEASIESIAYVQDGMHMDANPAYLKLFGYDNLDDLKEVPLLNLIDKGDQARFKKALKKPDEAGEPVEYEAVTATGTRIAVEIAMKPLMIAGHPSVQVVATDISKRRALETKLQSMHQRDSLTGLFSRMHFLNHLGEVLQSPGGAIIGLTVNHLADLNRQLGHVACDRFLVQLALQLRDTSGNQATIARVAGGQFALLLDSRSMSKFDSILGQIEKLSSKLIAGDGENQSRPEITVLGTKLGKTHKDRLAVMDLVFKPEPRRPAPAVAPAAVPESSPQVAAAPTPPSMPKPVAPAPRTVKPAPAALPTVAELPPLADEPNSGSLTPPPRAPVPTMPTISVAGAREDLRASVEHALIHNSMELVFQPIVNLHGDPHCFYEAQLLLVASDGTTIAPSRYLPSAEIPGLSGKLDRATMLNVIDTLSKFHLEGRPGIVFVSLTTHSIHDQALLSAVQMHTKATGLDPKKLVLQIEESALASDFEAARALIERTKEFGSGIALTNFANRAVSIEQLAQLPIDFVSINCGPDGLNETELYGAIDAIHATERMIIARGIEDADLFSALFSRGVHYVQGDYLQPASSGLDYSFEAEQTLASDEPIGPSWRVAG